VTVALGLSLEATTSCSLTHH